MKIIFKFLLCFILLLPLWLIVPEGLAQVQNCITNPTNPNAAGGLISAPSITGFSSKTGVCNLDPSSAFIPEKIPTYDDLKSRYYTQNNNPAAGTKHPLTGGDKTQDHIPFADAGDSLYHISDNLTISGNNQGTHTGVVFVEKNLNITGNYCYGSTCPSGIVNGTIGTVFIVKGKVNIQQAVTRIDAVIISSDNIYTATAIPQVCTRNEITSLPLIINGSLISLDSLRPIIFCRKLLINDRAAEQINHQVKYLVILRNLLSDTEQKWAEIQ